jgi:hypothetical protein
MEWAGLRNCKKAILRQNKGEQAGQKKRIEAFQQFMEQPNWKIYLCITASIYKNVTYERSATAFPCP